MYQADKKAETILQILGQFQRIPVLNRSELAAKLGLYTSTVSIRTKELIKLGLLRERGPGESGTQGGRKTTLLELNPGYGLFGAIYLGHSRLQAALFDPALNQTSYTEKKLIDGAIPRLLREMAGWMKAKAGTLSLRAVGTAVSSVVSEAGTVDTSSHFSRSLPELPRILADELPRAELVQDNDANLAAGIDLNLLEEGRRSLLHLLVYESIPTVGSGLVLNGALYRGPGGSAGELDEAIFPLNGAAGEELARLGCLMGRYLNIEALFISGELSPTERSRLVTALNSLNPEFPYQFIDDPHWVEKGAALAAMRKHIKTIAGVRR
ncbi:winged helix-turn-helix transcriptional regulator [Marispirochaeta sp.]|uniref:ROK family transcriptional regulator n=1 Tax=Marispirochaeta sp. TaxID=2038653 RepID=UPI0029C819F8|nr:winged helix-turn-helix transcriptional regulator [Marispirochaeta sp.]